MTIADRTLKARAKAAPDRIQEDISNATVIRNNKIEENQMQHIAERDQDDAISLSELPAGEISVPLIFWLENKAALLDREVVAVQIASDQDCEELLEDLSSIDVIVLPFVNFVDGRGYSQATKLRNHHGFTGEIRAIGDVHYDQLYFLARSGCNAFELPDGDDHQTALRALDEFSDVYQPATDGRELVFARRRVIH